MTLVIRKQQFAAIAAAKVAEFRRRVAHHVALCWPDEFGRRGVDGTAALVDEAIARGRELGFSGQRDIVRYVDALLLLERQGATPGEIRAAVDDAWAGPDPSGNLALLWQRAKEKARVHE
jgi:hypothetical protein